MPEYDGLGHSPPAPLAYVTLRTIGGGSEVAQVPMLLDTGSDVTLVPEAAVAKLGIVTDPSGVFDLEGFDGARSQAPIVRLELILEGRTFRGQFIAIRGERGILGRNTLNRLAILFDGPELSWNLNPPSHDGFWKQCCSRGITICQVPKPFKEELRCWLVRKFETFSDRKAWAASHTFDSWDDLVAAIGRYFATGVEPGS